MWRLTARTLTLGLLASCLACAGDTASPASPALAGLGSLAGEMGNGGGNGGGNGPPGGNTYTFEFGGDITNDGPIEANGGTTNFHDEPNAGTTLDVSFLGAVALPDFSVCFGAGVSPPLTAAPPGVVILNEDGSDPATMLTTFAALTADGQNTITYELSATGTTAGAFLPVNVNDTATLVLTDWSITNRKKKDAKKDPCMGSGTFTTTVLVTRIE